MATDAAVCLSRMRCVVLSVSIRIAMFKFKVVFVLEQCMMVMDFSKVLNPSMGARQSCGLF